MGCLDLGFVGKLDEDSIVSRNAFGAGIVEVQEVACASCVGNSIVVCGRRTVGERSGANVVTTMISLIECIHPCHFFFVGAAATRLISIAGLSGAPRRIYFAEPPWFKHVPM